MYRLYRALYPDEDIDSLPARVHRGDTAAKEAAQEWLAQRVKDLRRGGSVMAEALALKEEIAEKDKKIAELEAKLALHESSGPAAAAVASAAGDGGSI